MAKVTIQYQELYAQESKIVEAAAQSSRFLKVVDKQLKNGFGRNRANIAKGFVSEAVANIKARLRQGFPGASDTPGRRSEYTPEIEASGIHIGQVIVVNPPKWDDLADSTIKRKNRYKVSAPGRGKFWLDTGQLASATGALKPPRITYTTEVFPDSVRRQGKKDTRIDFAVTITVGEMPFPFDDMVRRPLVSGDYDGNIQADRAGSMGVKLVTNEYGYTEGDAQSYVPARPWIRQLSAAIGNAMLEELNTNR